MADLGTTGQVIAATNREGRAALIGYLPLGFPDLATTRRAGEVLSGRVDILLVGHPTTDPSCDSAKVSRALHRACAHGVDTEDLTDVVAGLAAQVPVVVWAYWHEIARLGAAGFCRELAHAGASGVVAPDLSAEHAQQWVQATDRHHLDRILAARADAPEAFLDKVAQHHRGWVYVPAVGEGVDAGAGAETARRMRAEHPDALLAIDVAGTTRQDAGAAAALADAVVAGTSLVQAMPDHAGDPLDDLAARADEIRAGLAR